MNARMFWFNPTLPYGQCKIYFFSEFILPTVLEIFPAIGAKLLKKGTVSDSMVNRGKFGVHDIFVKPDLRLKPSSVVMIFF